MRINLLKKLVVGGLITSLCLCCCFLNFNKNVKADILNENSYLFNDAFQFKNYDDILSLNDLKGTIWVMNYDYSTYNLEFFDSFVFNLSFDTNSTSNKLLDFPFAIQNTDGWANYNNVPNNTANFNLRSFNRNLFTLSSTFDSSLLKINIYHNFYSYYIEEDILIDKNYTYQTSSSYMTASFTSYSFNSYITTELCDIKKINTFTTSGSTYTNNFSPIFYFFPLSSDVEDYNFRYSFIVNGEDSTSIINEDYVIGEFKKHFTQVSLESIGYYYYRQSYNNGYNVGYSEGYTNGEFAGSDGAYRFSFLTGVLNAVSDVLALEIFPNVRLGYFVLIPLALGVTGMIFWFWRKD